MIRIENISTNIVKIKASRKITYTDFQRITPDIDKLIKKHGEIKLLIDATELTGWRGFHAFRQHIGFVITHQKHVEKIAVIISHNWQRCVAGVMRMFVHPQIRTFDKNHEKEAKEWVKRKK